MKKSLLLILVLLLSVSLFGCMNNGTGDKSNQNGASQGETENNQKNDETAVKKLVEDFGRQLQAVSLQAPQDILEKSMQEQYGAFVSPNLLKIWLADPLNAPGRLTSSPWPERIEIKSIEKLSETQYKVQGEVIEMTSAEKEHGGSFGKYDITLVVEKINDRWLINDATMGPEKVSSAVQYQNTEFGFSFSLPDSWKGYSIVTDKWQGVAIVGEKEGEVIETGPIISIRHPDWTKENPRQDIPIMIFTAAQWQSLQKEEFNVGAAPMGPTELGKNTSYIFALPARYNYAFPTGFEEVEKILEGKPLQTN